MPAPTPGSPRWATATSWAVRLCFVGLFACFTPTLAAVKMPTDINVLLCRHLARGTRRSQPVPGRSAPLVSVAPRLVLHCALHKCLDGLSLLRLRVRRPASS